MAEDEDPRAPISSSNFNSLSSDLVELILSFLPIPSLVRASAVCKLWCSLISSPIFPSLDLKDKDAPDHPWFFLYGLHNTSSRNHQSFAFDPHSNSWFSLPVHASVLNDELDHPSSSSLISSGSDGFLFTTTPCFSYTRLFRPSWRRVTSRLRFPRINPLLGVFHDDKDDSRGLLRFIVVGGVRFIGNLVDIEDRLAAEIYDPGFNSWDLCPPLPADFTSGNSSLSLSSALFRNRFYVFGISSCFISSFDLRNRIWSDVQSLRPPGLVFSFLVACRNRLVLAGMCAGPAGASFNLWEVDERTMEFSKIAIMPPDLLNGLVDSEDDDNKFASLKCVGMGDLIYVFNEEYHKKYPACVCEISGEHGKCRWRRLPDLPSPVNKFHKVISFCSAVTIQTVLLPACVRW